MTAPFRLDGRRPSARLSVRCWSVPWWGHSLPDGTDSFAGKARAKHPAGHQLQQKLLSACLQLHRPSSTLVTQTCDRTLVPFMLQFAFSPSEGESYCGCNSRSSLHAVAVHFMSLTFTVVSCGCNERGDGVLWSIHPQPTSSNTSAEAESILLQAIDGHPHRGHIPAMSNPGAPMSRIARSSGMHAPQSSHRQAYCRAIWAR